LYLLGASGRPSFIYGEPEDNSLLVKVKYQEDENLSQKMTQALKSKLGDSAVILLSEESVGPKVGAELRKRGIFAVILTWVLFP